MINKARCIGYFGIASVCLLSACASPSKTTHTPTRPPVSETSNNSKTTHGVSAVTTSALPKANSGRGGYYKDDGPGDDIPDNLESTVDPIPTIEPYSRTGNRPYVVFGKTYTPLTDTTASFKQRGIASWYGKKFHGKKTSSGEPYDMYKMTAAHPTLPIPSYARVTNIDSGKQIIVRINDRGPFHASRIIDLSYTAALKLGYLTKGSMEIEVERLLPEDIEKMAENRNNQTSRLRTTSTMQPTPIIEPDKAALENLLASREKQYQDTEITSVTNTNPRSTAGNFYLQFGAYAIRANAQAMLDKVIQENNGRLTNGEKFEVVQQGNLYRLYLGPFATRDDAQENTKVGAGVLTIPIVVQRQEN